MASLSQKNAKNCIVCTLSPLLSLGSLLGIFPLTYSCQHSATPTLNAYFKVSKKHQIISVVVIIILLLELFWYCYLSGKISETNKILFTQMLAEIFYFSSGFILVLLSLVNVKKRVTDLNGWISICENRHIFGISIVIDEKLTQKLRRRGRLLVYLSCSFLFFLCMYTFGREYKGFLNWTTIRRPACVLSTFVQLITVFELTIHQNFLSALFDSFKSTLQRLLLRKIEKQVKIGDENEDDESDTLESQLKEIQKFHHAMVKNFKALESYVGPIFLLWFLLILAVLTVNIYILIFVWINDHNSTFFIMLEIRTYFIIFAVSYLLHCVEGVAVVSNDILSFLYKYPISKLSVTEANQVEILIKTLTIQKPVLRASDIFVIGTRLLAAISGTVITYVLVALQFHARWEH